MSIEGKGPAEEGTPTCVTRFDGIRVPATDYHPVWLDSLADDVAIEGSAMNGVAQGPGAVRTIVISIRALYDSQEFNFAGPYGENGFLEDYTALVRGEPLGNVVLVTRNAAGQAQHIVAKLPAPEHTAAVVPAQRRAARWHPIRRVLRYQRPRVRVRRVHSIAFLVLSIGHRREASQLWAQRSM